MIRFITLTYVALSFALPVHAQISIRHTKGEVQISLKNGFFARYVYNDEKTTRPYFMHLHAPNGIQVTRNHPPLTGDLKDHATYHPGLFLAFGDLNGNDYWRLKAKVVHDKFLNHASISEGKAQFSVKNVYFPAKSKEPVCEEQCVYTISSLCKGILLTWDSTFSSDVHDFYFGDQEEMGLGVRMNTLISVNQDKGGRILDSKGRINGKQIWGKTAKWCDYSGKVGKLSGGVTLMPHPKNFRSSWFHARDYGFLAANPFGRNAFTQGKKSKVIVKKGEKFRLRFGIFVHSEMLSQKEIEKAYQQYLKQ